MTAPTRPLAEMPELLTQAETAPYLRVSLRTLKKLRRARLCPIPEVRHGRQVLFRRTDLQAYLTTGPTLTFGRRRLA